MEQDGLEWQTESSTLKEFSLDIKQLAQFRIFEKALQCLHKLCPKLRNLIFRSANQNHENEVNQGYYPIEVVKVGFENIERLKAVKIPLKGMDFIGMLGRRHSYTPKLIHLDVVDAFDEVLMDLRDFMTQESILETLKLNQWICCDESFCAYFGHL